MSGIEYLELGKIDPAALIPLLNKQKIRKHLVDHALFDAGTAKAWLEKKIEMDACQGCKVRAIVVNKRLAGWCGIQCEDGNYEIAVVLNDDHWGIGKKIFRELMIWAKDLGHKTVFIHFLHTRPEYKHLRKISKNVYESQLMGSKFTTYELTVE